MKIEVCCSICTKRFAAPERLAGKRVKCPLCGNPIDVPSLNSPGDDPLAGFSEEDLTAGPALAGLTPPPSRAPSSRPTAAGSSSKPGKPASRTSWGGEEPRSILDVFVQNRLFSAVLAVTALGLIACVGGGHLISAGVYLVVGGAASLLGLRTVLNPSRESQVAERRGERFTWWGGTGLLLLVLVVAIGRAGRAADPVKAIVLVGATIVIVVLLIGLAFLAALMLDVGRGRGVFRAVALGYLILFGALPTITLMALPNGLSGAVPAVARKTAKDLPVIPLPTFPQRGAMRSIAPGVEFGEVWLAAPPGEPGRQGRLYLYLPSGDHAPRSLPCVLIAPAGSTPLTGMQLGEGDQAEHTPYVKAGFAVVAYELDGPLDAPGASERSAFEQYAAALGGLVNARNALEYVLQKMPEVDPQRIYAAGHSSAGTMALVLAEVEPRIHGCVAYAPATDLVERTKPAATQLRLFVPGSLEFVAEWSPRTHEAQIHCPVFLFHARDDSNVSFDETAEFCSRLQALGKRVTFKAVDSGDHYDSMIREGIPAGIEWLQSLAPPVRGTAEP